MEHLQIPGLLVPGPPLHMRRSDEDGLTVTTSNDGTSAAWPQAHTQARVRQFTARISGLMKLSIPFRLNDIKYRY
jgi:hypothetical protein